MKSAADVNSPAIDAAAETGPVASVIIIARNEQDYIAECIESVMAATAGIDAEIILVDSRSEDNTPTIAERFPIKILQLEEGCPLTASSARHAGFMDSAGTYIQFIDGDMTIHQEWISRAIRFLKGSDDSTAAVTGRIIQEETNNPYYARLGQNLQTATKTKEAKELTCLFASFMIKAEALRKVGSYDPRLRAGEEGELFDRIRAKGYKIVLLPHHCSFHHVKDLSFLQLLKKKMVFSFAEGQVFRRSLFNKRVFCHRLLYYKSHFLFAAYMTLGSLGLLMLLISRYSLIMYIWLFCFISFFAFLVIREKGNIIGGTYCLVGYLFSWLFFFGGFFGAAKIQGFNNN